MVAGIKGSVGHASKHLSIFNGFDHLGARKQSSCRDSVLWSWSAPQTHKPTQSGKERSREIKRERSRERNSNGNEGSVIRSSIKGGISVVQIVVVKVVDKELGDGHRLFANRGLGFVTIVDPQESVGRPNHIHVDVEGDVSDSCCQRFSS